MDRSNGIRHGSQEIQVETRHQEPTGILGGGHTQCIHQKKKHQEFQVPKMEVLTYKSCMQGWCKANLTPKTAL